MMALIVAFTLAALSETPPPTPEPPAGSELTIELAIFGPGDDAPEVGGHLGVIIADGKATTSKLYNYGVFSADPGALARMAAGELIFVVTESDTETAFAPYRERGRAIVTQRLALTPSERLTLARLVRADFEQGKGGYVYDHFAKNCATRPRDVIDQALFGQLARDAMSAAARMSMRDHVRRMASRTPWVAVLYDFIGNGSLEAPVHRWEETFLPSELASLVRATTVTHDDNTKGPLLAAETIVFAGTRAPIADAPPAWTLRILALGVALAAVGFGFARMRARAFLQGIAHVTGALFVGVPGLVLLCAWLFTSHTVAHANATLWCATPLALAAIPCALFAHRSARAATALKIVWTLCALSVLIGIALRIAGGQHTEWQLALFGSTSLALAIAAWSRRA